MGQNHRSRAVRNGLLKDFSWMDQTGRECSNGDGRDTDDSISGIEKNKFKMLLGLVLNARPESP